MIVILAPARMLEGSMCFPRNTNPLPAITYKLYLKLSYEFHVHILNIPRKSAHMSDISSLTICCIAGVGKLTDAAHPGMFQKIMTCPPASASSRV